MADKQFLIIKERITSTHNFNMLESIKKDLERNIHLLKEYHSKKYDSCNRLGISLMGLNLPMSELEKVIETISFEKVYISAPSFSHGNNKSYFFERFTTPENINLKLFAENKHNAHLLLDSKYVSKTDNFSLELKEGFFDHSRILEEWFLNNYDILVGEVKEEDVSNELNSFMSFLDGKGFLEAEELIFEEIEKNEELIRLASDSLEKKVFDSTNPYNIIKTVIKTSSEKLNNECDSIKFNAVKICNGFYLFSETIRPGFQAPITEVNYKIFDKNGEVFYEITFNPLTFKVIEEKLPEINQRFNMKLLVSSINTLKIRYARIKTENSVKLGKQKILF